MAEPGSTEGTATLFYKDLTDGSNKAFTGYCLDDGWMVVQSRGQFGNPDDYFYRGWDEYVAGFGVPGE